MWLFKILLIIFTFFVLINSSPLRVSNSTKKVKSSQIIVVPRRESCSSNFGKKDEKGRCREAF